MTVLIADDSELIRTNLSKLIRNILQDVHIFTTSEVASSIESLREFRVDALILDIQMPDGTGFDVLEAMGGLENRPFTIVLTNFAGQSTRKKSLSLGADLVFDKSNEFEKVVDVLSSLSQTAAKNAEGE